MYNRIKNIVIKAANQQHNNIIAYSFPKSDNYILKLTIKAKVRQNKKERGI